MEPSSVRSLREKVEVTSFGRLQHRPSVQRLVTARRCRRRTMVRQAPLDLGILDKKVDLFFGDRQPDTVPVAYCGERTADGGLWSDVQDDRTERRPGHARVRNADHVLDA